ncbi:MAG: hypothetical protein ABIN61_06070 [candidate division WOR-3 bacterium]
MGYKNDSSEEIKDTFELSPKWSKYEIDLTGKNLSDICAGFFFVFNQELDPNPDGCTFYLDEISFNLPREDSIRFLQSYEMSSSKNYRMANKAYTYDNALAMIAFLVRGTQEDIRRARIIGDAFKYAQENDRYYKDGRLRNAYSSGDIIHHQTGKARLPGWWDSDSSKWFEDSYDVGTYTGEMAWIIIAWLSYDSITNENRYIQNAIDLGNWIYEHCYDSTGIPGYTGGYIGWEPQPTKENWKSTEHNIDVYVAFKRLYHHTGNDIWLKRSIKALNFVKSLWDSSTKHFWSGTLDSLNINDFSPLDAQTFGALALDEEPYDCGFLWAEDNCCVSLSEYKGFHFSNICDGIWWEGTAQMCCTYFEKNKKDKADTYIEELRKWQEFSSFGNKQGIVACYPDSIWTGLTRFWGKWYYYADLHIGATSWYIFAERKINPFWGSKMGSVEKKLILLLLYISVKILSIILQEYSIAFQETL